MLRPLIVSALTLAACSMCGATALYFNASGVYGGGDTSDAFVKPGDTFGITFVVQSNPVVNNSNSTAVSFDIPVLGFYYRLNGVIVNVGQPSEITFDTSGIGGGFDLNFANGTEFVFSGSQYFTGTTSAPVFSPGAFSNQSFTFLDNNNVDSGSATANLTPTPEPTSFALLCGGLGLLAVGIRRFVGVRK